ncbi:MAG: acetylxylan esterase, partial [Armatimonadetes bacterium]|nr:acetylxylan esterase [Armatimonadota bacterium]
QLAVSGAHGYKFEFTSEEGVRLGGWLMAPDSLTEPWPAVVLLRNRGEGRAEPQNFASGFSAALGRIVVDLRGTGDTAWARELDWHVRRACAWTGRTVASMWVWDLLRAIEAVRSLPEVDGERIVLAARGEMCVPAVYAALLDGRLAGLLLQSPPASHDLASPPDGTGPALEMLRVLRYTDLPYAAGLLWPLPLAVAHPVPQTWWWTIRLYQRLGEPGRVDVLGDIRHWRPGG